MKSKVGKIFVLLFMAIFVGMALPISSGFLLSAAEQYDEYYRLENTAVTVTATITSMKEKDDGDGGTDYVTYITYSYQGMTFEDVKYKTFGSDKHYGEKVQIEIDPENPAHLRPDHSGMTQIVLGGLITIVCFGLASLSAIEILTHEKVRNNWQEIYAVPHLSKGMVHMDFLFENQQRRRYSIIFSGIMLVLLSGALAYSYVETHTLTAPVAWGVTILVYVVLEVVYYMLYNDKQIEFTLIKDRVLSITTETDSDGDKRNVWSFSCCNRWIPTPNCFVSLEGKMLRDVYAGSVVYIVLNKTQRIERIFDAREFKLYKEQDET